MKKTGPAQANKRDHSSTLPAKKTNPKSEESSSSKDGEKPAKATATAVTEKQKAIVKPQILTHMIEGFVIQEGSEPFPVSIMCI